MSKNIRGFDKRPTHTLIRCNVAWYRECNGIRLQYSCLENPMDGGAWWAAVHGITRSQTRLSDFSFIFHFRALEKEMATHSSVLAWRISGTGEPGGLPSMGSHRVGHDWSYLAAAAAVPWYRTYCQKWWHAVTWQRFLQNDVISRGQVFNKKYRFKCNCQSYCF